MAFSEKLADRVRDALSDHDNVEQKMMFSGVAFLVNDKMCVNVTRNGLMCRIDPDLHEELLETHDCETMIMKGKELKGWVIVREENIRSVKDLQFWIGHALAYNAKAKSSKKKKAGSK